MKNIYIVKISGTKSKIFFERLVKYHVYMIKIKKIKDGYLLYLDEENYRKVLNYKTIYSVELIDVKGIIKWKVLFRKYRFFLISIILGIGLLYFLSNIIFEVVVLTDDTKIKNLVLSELKEMGISKYRFSVSFDKRREIVNHILENNKKTLEWLEIEKIGVKYVVRLEKRIIDKEKEELKPSNIVAKKNGIIKKIIAKEGSIVRKVNDYVKVGDIIITGIITHNDQVVKKVPALGKVYAETWYTINVEMPLSYYEEIYTGREKEVISLCFLKKCFNFLDFSPYKDKKIEEKIIIENRMIPLKISKNKFMEVNIIDERYTKDEAIDKALLKAREKLFTIVPSDSKILAQKKLKITEKDSRIVIDIFFKIYEDITNILEIKEE